MTDRDRRPRPTAELHHAAARWPLATRRVALGAATAALLAGGLAAPAAAGPVSDPTSLPPSPNVDATPAAVVADGLADLAAASTGIDAGKSTPAVPAAPRATSGAIRVVSVVEAANGAPVTKVQTVQGVRAAVATVKAAQRADNLVDVGVDLPVHLDTAKAATQVKDPLRARQWGMTRLRAETDWARSTGSGVVVAVVDTGVDGTHPDLKGRVARGFDFVKPGGTGWSDANGHGTHVAGVLAAVRGNTVGGSGLAPAATVLPVRALDADGAGWTSDIVRGIVWAADHRAKVINLSLGGEDDAPGMAGAVAYAQSRGALVVVAAGNARTEGSPVSYPAAYPSVLAVAAVDKADKVATFSTAGSYVGIAAPGTDILSTWPRGRYVLASGTSMATPFVSAAAALLFALPSHPNAAAVAQALTSTAKDVGVPGRDVDTGAGVVDPAAALCALGNCPPGFHPARSTPAPGTPTPTPPLTLTTTVAHPTAGRPSAARPAQR